MTRGAHADPHLLDQILLSEQSEREALWTQLNSASADDSFSRVLLQSLPGHPGYAPLEARRSLQALLQQGQLDEGEQRLLRLRLTDLRYEAYLQQQLRERDRRLKSLVDIERDLHGVGAP